MTTSALVLTYHAIERLPGPLSVDRGLLAEQLDVVRDAGVATLTVAELAHGLRDGALPARAVVLTFDDAFASVAEQAAPLLAERGQRATVFVVAGAIGATNAWPSQPSGTPVAGLADLPQLRALAAAGWEIGSHGTEHAPLARISEAAARREIADSRAALEHELQLHVSSFALPYGALPAPAADELLHRTYDAVCTTRLGRAGPAADRWAIPRVDVHYLRHPGLLRRAVGGSAGGYLRARGVAAQARRLVRKDYVESAR